MGVREPFDVIEERKAGGVPIGEAVASQQLAFERGEETLSSRMIEAITAATHGSREPSFTEPSTEGQTGVLAALVRVMNDALRWSPSGDGHIDRFDD